MKNILAINPWIYDFAAYDYWLKPYGFLQLLEYLKNYDFDIKFLDLLDRYHPWIKKDFLNQKKFGTGKYYDQEIKKPNVLNWVPRKYKRYGIPKNKVNQHLFQYEPEIIMITSSMTYWYPGVFEIIKLCKKHFPSVPVILGGTYATLCHTHAKKFSGADYVISFKNLSGFSNIINEITHKKIKINHNKLKNITPSYFQYYDFLPYAVTRTSWGCPFNCSYCASNHLSFSEKILVNPKRVVSQINQLNQKGIKDFIFYDDALLSNKNHIEKILSRIISSEIKGRFHTPNGLHAKFLDSSIAKFFKKMNFVNPRVSLESMDTNIPNFKNKKVDFSEIKKSISNLRKAGYRKGEYSIYLLLGIPGENLNLIEKHLFQIHKLGAHIYLTEFSPIPLTKIWKNIKFNKKEPLLQNNSIFPFYKLEDWNNLQKLKNLAQQLNKKL